MNNKAEKSSSQELAAKRRLLSRLINSEIDGENPPSKNREGKPQGKFQNLGIDIEGKKQQARLQYPALRQRAYFNYGAQGPLAESAMTAIFQTMLELQYLGSFSAEAQARSQLEFQLTRQSLAKLLGVESENIVLTENTTSACNIVLWGLDWQHGDHLLVSDCENPSLMIAIEYLRRRYSLDVEVLSLTELNDREILEVIDASLKQRTRLLVLSHVLWNTGRLLPLDKIMQGCAAGNRHFSTARVLVDGAQTVGMLELDLNTSQIDFYAFGGQKWLCGPEGTGALYISRTALNELQPTFTGWRGLAGSNDNNTLVMHTDARRFEIASSSTALQAGLRAALECHNDFAPAGWIFEHILEMSRYLWQKLQDLSQAGFPIRCLSAVAPASGLVSFEVEEYDPVRLVRFLEVQGILTRFINPPACIRACVHYLTTTDEIDELVTGIKLFVKSRS